MNSPATRGSGKCFGCGSYQGVKHFCHDDARAAEPILMLGNAGCLEAEDGGAQERPAQEGARRAKSPNCDNDEDRAQTIAKYARESSCRGSF